MDVDTYPDVTLARNSAAPEQQALNASLSQEGVSGKNTFVVLKSRRKQYLITPCRIVLIIAAALLALIIAILITIFLSMHRCNQFSSHPHPLSCNQTISSDLGSWVSGSNVSTLAPTQNNSDIPQPWSQIRLPQSLRPSFYELHLQIDLKKFVYQGSVNITVQVAGPTRYIIFHRSSFYLDPTLVGVSSRYSPTRHVVRQFPVLENSFHVIELDKDIDQEDTLVLSVGYFNGSLGEDLRGLYKSSYVNQEGQHRDLAVTQFQPMDARRVFPCFDEPHFKARFKMSVTYQTGYTALTNMPATSTTVVSPEWVRKDFESTPVMSTYLLAILVSDFKSRNFTFPDGYQLKIWARPEAYSQTEHALEVAKSCYTFFTEFFGCPDVVRKADHVAVPDFGAAAMENWGLVVYRETALLYDREVSSSLNKYTVSLVVAHEIAHTWFGNMATMKWWDDLWLNEGFANLLMYVALNESFPQWNVFAIVIVDEMLPVMVEDALTTSHPVSAQINNPDEINQRFDSISYSKGMAVLRMMMDFAGSDMFQSGLRMYVERYKFSNADMAQLWSVFTEAFNYTYDVARIMDTWTRQMGYPVVTIEEDGPNLLLHQQVFLLDQTMHAVKDKEDNPFGYKWYIPFTYVTGDSPNHKRSVWLNLGSASIPKPTNSWLLGNYGMAGFYRVRYNRRMWAQLAHQLLVNHTVIPEASRAGLIGDAFALARADLLDYEVAFNLTRYLRKETSYIPWQAFLHSIEFIKAMIVNRVAYIQLQKYMEELVAPVFNNLGASDKGELPERYLRRVILSIACDIGMEEAVSYAKSMFANWMKHDTRLPPDLAMLIYSVGVREGGPAEWDYVWKRSLESKVNTESEMLLESLAYTQKPWLLWRYINWMLDHDKIRLQNVRFVIGYFSKTPLARMIALDFLMSRWSDIVKTFNMDFSLLSELITKTTSHVNTDFHLQQLQGLFQTNTPRSTQTAVENSFALIRANIGWMNANYQEIEDWLSHKNV